MNTDDELRFVPSGQLSKEEMGHAGVKDISTVKDYRVRQEGAHTVHVVSFGDTSSLTITYSNVGKVVSVEPRGVRFERLGDSLFVMKV